MTRRTTTTAARRRGAGRQPLYRWLRDTLAKQIATGQYRVGQMLPSEGELCRMHEVSRITVRQALADLANEGLLTKRQGRGTVVARATPVRNADRRTVHLVMANALGSFTSLLIKGVQLAISERDFDLAVHIADDDPHREKEILRKIHDIQPAGVLVFPVSVQREIGVNCVEMFKFTESRVPLLCLDHYLPDVPIGYVTADDYQAAADLVQHMVKCDFERIGFLEPGHRATSLTARRAGFTDTMIRVRRTLDPDLSIRTEARRAGVDDVALGEHALRRVLESGASLPEAIIAANAYLAIGAMRAIKAHGLRIPDDIAVAGIGDPPEAAVLEPAMTVLRNPMEGLGRRAAEELIKLIETNSLGQDVRIRLPGRLIVRQSTPRRATVARA